MQRTLFQVDGAPPSWRVCLGIALKGIDVDIHALGSSERERRAPEIRALNFRGTLPILQDVDTCLHNSLAILAWLDRAYPEVPLFGANLDEAAQIWQTVMDGYDFFREANRQLLTVTFSADGAPLKDNSPELERLNSGAALAHAECRDLESHLSDGRKFICGGQPSAADAVLFPEVRLIERAIATKAAVMTQAGLDNMADQYPHVSAWMEGLEAMPAVRATLPRHWGDAIK